MHRLSALIGREACLYYWILRTRWRGPDRCPYADMCLALRYVTRMPSARPVPIPAEKYPFPFRTRKSSPPGPMVLTPNPASGEQVGAGLAEGIT